MVLAQGTALAYTPYGIDAYPSPITRPTAVPALPPGQVPGQSTRVGLSLLEAPWDAPQMPFGPPAPRAPGGSGAAPVAALAGPGEGPDGGGLLGGIGSGLLDLAGGGKGLLPKGWAGDLWDDVTGFFGFGGAPTAAPGLSGMSPALTSGAGFGALLPTASPTSLASGAGFGAFAPGTTPSLVGGAAPTLGSLALAAAPLALPFVMGGLFGKKKPWNPRESAEGLNRAVARYAANPDYTPEELAAAREDIANMAYYNQWPEGHPNYRPYPTITPEEQAEHNRLFNIGGLAFGAVPSLRGENTPIGPYAIFHQYMSPEAKAYLLENADAYSEAFRANRAAYPAEMNWGYG